MTGKKRKLSENQNWYGNVSYSDGDEHHSIKYNESEMNNNGVNVNKSRHEISVPASLDENEQMQRGETTRHKPPVSQEYCKGNNVYTSLKHVNNDSYRNNRLSSTGKECNFYNEQIESDNQSNATLHSRKEMHDRENETVSMRSHREHDLLTGAFNRGVAYVRDGSSVKQNVKLHSIRESRKNSVRSNETYRDAWKRQNAQHDLNDTNSSHLSSVLTKEISIRSDLCDNGTGRSLFMAPTSSSSLLSNDANNNNNNNTHNSSSTTSWLRRSVRSHCKRNSSTSPTSLEQGAFTHDDEQSKILHFNDLVNENNITSNKKTQEVNKFKEREESVNPKTKSHWRKRNLEANRALRKHELQYGLTTHPCMLQGGCLCKSHHTRNGSHLVKEQTENDAHKSEKHSNTFYLSNDRQNEIKAHCPHLHIPSVCCLEQLERGKCEKYYKSECPWHHGELATYRSDDMRNEVLFVGDELSKENTQSFRRSDHLLSEQEHSIESNANNVAMRLRESTSSICILLNMFIDLVTITVESTSRWDSNSNTVKNKDYNEEVREDGVSYENNVDSLSNNSKRMNVDYDSDIFNTNDIEHLSKGNNYSHTTLSNEQSKERCPTNRQVNDAQTWERCRALYEYLQLQQNVHKERNDLSIVALYDSNNTNNNNKKKSNKEVGENEHPLFLLSVDARFAWAAVKEIYHLSRKSKCTKGRQEYTPEIEHEQSNLSLEYIPSSQPEKELNKPNWLHEETKMEQSHWEREVQNQEDLHNHEEEEYQPLEAAAMKELEEMWESEEADEADSTGATWNDQEEYNSFLQDIKHLWGSYFIIYEDNDSCAVNPSNNQTSNNNNNNISKSCNLQSVTTHQTRLCLSSLLTSFVFDKAIEQTQHDKVFDNSNDFSHSSSDTDSNIKDKGNHCTAALFIQAAQHVIRQRLLNSNNQLSQTPMLGTTETSLHDDKDWASLLLLRDCCLLDKLGTLSEVEQSTANLRLAEQIDECPSSHVPTREESKVNGIVKLQQCSSMSLLEQEKKAMLEPSSCLSSELNQEEDLLLARRKEFSSNGTDTHFPDVHASSQSEHLLLSILVNIFSCNGESVSELSWPKHRELATYFYHDHANTNRQFHKTTHANNTFGSAELYHNFMPNITSAGHKTGFIKVVEEAWLAVHCCLLHITAGLLERGEFRINLQQVINSSSNYKTNNSYTCSENIEKELQDEGKTEVDEKLIIKEQSESAINVEDAASHYNYSVEIPRCDDITFVHLMTFVQTALIKLSQSLSHAVEREFEERWLEFNGWQPWSVASSIARFTSKLSQQPSSLELEEQEQEYESMNCDNELTKTYCSTSSVLQRNRLEGQNSRNRKRHFSNGITNKMTSSSFSSSCSEPGVETSALYTSAGFARHHMHYLGASLQSSLLNAFLLQSLTSAETWFAYTERSPLRDALYGPCPSGSLYMNNIEHVLQNAQLTFNTSSLHRSHDRTTNYYNNNSKVIETSAQTNRTELLYKIYKKQLIECYYYRRKKKATLLPPFVHLALGFLNALNELNETRISERVVLTNAFKAYQSDKQHTSQETHSNSVNDDADEDNTNTTAYNEYVNQLKYRSTHVKSAKRSATTSSNIPYMRKIMHKPVMNSLNKGNTNSSSLMLSPQASPRRRVNDLCEAEAVPLIDQLLPFGSICVSCTNTALLLRILLESNKGRKALKLIANMIYASRLLRHAIEMPLPVLVQGTKKVYKHVWSARKQRKVLQVNRVPVFRVVKTFSSHEEGNHKLAQHGSTAINSYKLKNNESENVNKTSSKHDDGSNNKNNSNTIKRESKYAKTWQRYLDKLMESSHVQCLKLMYEMDETVMEEMIRTCMHWTCMGTKLADGIVRDCVRGKLLDFCRGRSLPVVESEKEIQLYLIQVERLRDRKNKQEQCDNTLIHLSNTHQTEFYGVCNAYEPQWLASECIHKMNNTNRRQEEHNIIASSVMNSLLSMIGVKDKLVNQSTEHSVLNNLSRYNINENLKKIYESALKNVNDKVTILYPVGITPVVSVYKVMPTSMMVELLMVLMPSINSNQLSFIHNELLQRDLKRFMSIEVLLAFHVQFMRRNDFANVIVGVQIMNDMWVYALHLLPLEQKLEPNMKSEFYEHYNVNANEERCNMLDNEPIIRKEEENLKESETRNIQNKTEYKKSHLPKHNVCKRYNTTELQSILYNMWRTLRAETDNAFEELTYRWEISNTTMNWSKATNLQDVKRQLEQSSTNSHGDDSNSELTSLDKTKQIVKTNNKTSHSELLKEYLEMNVGKSREKNIERLINNISKILWALTLSTFSNVSETNLASTYDKEKQTLNETQKNSILQNNNINNRFMIYLVFSLLNCKKTEQQEMLDATLRVLLLSSFMEDNIHDKTYINRVSTYTNENNILQLCTQKNNKTHVHTLPKFMKMQIILAKEMLKKYEEKETAEYENTNKFISPQNVHKLHNFVKELESMLSYDDDKQNTNKKVQCL